MKNAYLLGLLPLLAACTARDDAAYPTLAPRPIEKLATAEPAAAPAQPASSGLPADPSFAERLKAARAALAGAATAMDAAVAAAGQPMPDAEKGSEAWVENQQALSRLESAGAGLRNVETDASALAADLAVARVSGVDTRALDTETSALHQDIRAQIERGEDEIKKRK